MYFVVDVGHEGIANLGFDFMADNADWETNPDHPVAQPMDNPKGDAPEPEPFESEPPILVEPTTPSTAQILGWSNPQASQETDEVGLAWPAWPHASFDPPLPLSCLLTLQFATCPSLLSFSNKNSSSQLPYLHIFQPHLAFKLLATVHASHHQGPTDNWSSVKTPKIQ